MNNSETFVPDKSNRSLYLDIVKGFAIILVVYGHCIDYYSDEYISGNLFYSDELHKIIYSFHMPLFMLVCGYFSSRSLDIPMKTLIMKKGKQLLIPVVCCTIITIILFGGVFREEIIGCVWFLKTLFVCYFIARLAKYIKIPIEIMFPLSWVILLIIPFGGTLMINFSISFFVLAI